MDLTEVDGRLEGVELVVPVCVGTMAFFLGKKATDQETHKWTVYVRSPTGEDLRPLIREVVVELHPSFKDPVRVIEQPPFELTEVGWGEFDIGIKIRFAEDARERDLELFHRLKLYSEEGGQQQHTQKPVVKETYEEIVFVDPRAIFYERVASLQPSLPQYPPSTLSEFFPVYDEEHEVGRINAIRRKVAQQTENLKRQYEQSAIL